MSLVPVAEPRTAEELYEHYKRVRARLDNPGTFKPSAPKPAVVDLFARRRAEKARREAEQAVAAAQAKAMAEASGAFGARRTAVAILRQVADKHGTTPAEIIGPSRHAKLVAARFEAVAAVAKANPQWSLPQLGRFFGGRDHTTILNALHRMGVSERPRRVKNPPELERAVVQARMRFGLSVNRIAEIQNVDRKTVQRILAKHEAKQAGEG